MDLKEIRKQLEDEQIQRQVMADDTSPAPGPVSDTVQNMFNRTVRIIGDEHDNNDASLGELNSGNFDVNGDGTKITKIFDANGDLKQSLPLIPTTSTEDEIYNLVSQGTWYRYGTYIILAAYKGAPEVAFYGFNGTIQNALEGVQIICKPGVTTIPTHTASTFITGTPTKDTHATTKKYVDDKVASAPTPKVMIRQIDTLGASQKTWLEEHWDSIISATVRPYSYVGKSSHGFWQNTFLNSTEPIVAGWWHSGTSYGPSEDKSAHELRASFNIPTHYDNGSYNVGYMSLKKDGTGWGKIHVQTVGDGGRTSASYTEYDYDDVWTFTYLEIAK